MWRGKQNNSSDVRARKFHLSFVLFTLSMLSKTRIWEIFRTSHPPSQGMKINCNVACVFYTVVLNLSSNNLCAVKKRFHCFLPFCLTSSGNLDRFTSEFKPMECLGRGGFGRVHKAKHKLLKKDYAVKIVRCEE